MVHCADDMDELFSTPKVQLERLLDKVSDAPDDGPPIQIMAGMVRCRLLLLISQRCR